MPGPLSATQVALTAALSELLEHHIGPDLLGAAQRDAPVLEGHLRASGDYEVIHDGRDVYVLVFFTEPYAAKQHEELDYHHPKGGKAKYLEDQVKARHQLYERAARATVAATLRGVARGR